MSYRSSSPPVSGFGGHIPGGKWQVGSRNSNNFSNSSQIRQSSNLEPEPTIVSDTSHTFDFEGNPIPRFPPFFYPQMTPAEYTQLYNQQMANLQANGAQMMQYPNGMMPMYGFNPAYSMNGGMPSSASMQGISQSQISPGNQSINGQQRSRNDDRNQDQGQQQKARSKSMPRKPKSDVRDIFGGIESGWWSEGQALKNIRRHQQNLTEAAGLSSKSNGNLASDQGSTTSRFRRRIGADDDDDMDVPTPGYSGHVPGIKTYGIGKPFTIAAKESRRRMHSHETSHNSAIKPKNQQNQESQSSQLHSQQQAAIQPQGMQVNGFPNQQAFMNSYPYMAPNGMMQPMYMGLPMGGQPNPNANPSGF